MYQLEASYNALKGYAYRLRISLSDIDPNLSQEARFELARIEGVLQYMKSEIERHNRERQ